MTTPVTVVESTRGHHCSSARQQTAYAPERLELVSAQLQGDDTGDHSVRGISELHAPRRQILRRQHHRHVPSTRTRVQVVTGNRDFTIFQDVDGIGLGEDWRDKLADSIAGSVFFVPVITALYFTSPACRDELERFQQHA